MRSKELSLSVKQAIIRLKNQNKPIREIAKILGVAKSTVWNILKKKEHQELRNTKRPGRPWKTTVVADRRILSLVKKNPFTTVGQIKNTLQEVGVCVSKSTIKKRGFTTRCKPLVILKNRKIRLEFAKQHIKKPLQFRNNILWTDETKINLYQNDVKRRVWRRKGIAHDPKHTTSSVKHGGGSVMVWAKCFRTHWMALHSADGQCILRKQPKSFFKAKKWNVMQWPSQSPDLNPIEHAFNLLKTKLKGKCPKNKQELKTVAVEA